MCMVDCNLYILITLILLLVSTVSNHVNLCTLGIYLLLNVRLVSFFKFWSLNCCDFVFVSVLILYLLRKNYCNHFQFTCTDDGIERL